LIVGAAAEVLFQSRGATVAVSLPLHTRGDWRVILGQFIRLYSLSMPCPVHGQNLDHRRRQRFSKSNCRLAPFGLHYLQELGIDDFIQGIFRLPIRFSRSQPFRQRNGTRGGQWKGFGLPHRIGVKITALWSSCHKIPMRADAMCNNLTRMMSHFLIDEFIMRKS